jgi:hypothetical protein
MLAVQKVNRLAELGRPPVENGIARTEQKNGIYQQKTERVGRDCAPSDSMPV